jgi:alpha-beta hydrolase superfamily lysophospholipase
VRNVVVAVLLAALAAAPAASPHASWDGCTKRAGDITFAAPDGTRLAGHLFGHGKVGVVLAHQSDGNLCQWVEYATHLGTLGYTALAFDFRNVGSSQVRHYPANLRYGGDVAGAARALRQRGATKVVLVGASLGGSAVIQAAANVRPPVDGVVSVSGAADLSNAIQSAPGLRVPVLYLAASGDRDFAADAKRLYAATRERAKRLLLLDDSRHGTSLVGGNPAARRAVDAFIAAR